MKHCKSCAFWTRETKEGRDHVGECKSPTVVYTGGMGDYTPFDGIGYRDMESYSAYIEFGEDFGCIHHQ